MSKFTQLLLVGGFVAMLVTPAVFSVVKPDTAVLPNMAQQPLPTKPWLKRFPKQFEGFIDTHLGLRRQLVTAQGAFEFYFFGTTPSAAVLPGEDGWAFLNQDFMPESIAGGPFPTPELAAWAAVFKQAQSQMDQWGGKVLVVVAPNKATIYPEFLPKHVRDARQKPRLDAFLSHLEGEKIPTVDLRPVLLAQKSKGLLYAKRDTHWVGRGIAAAAIAMSRKVEQLTGKPSLLTDEHVLFDEGPYTGDLARMLALEGWADERVEFPRVHPPHAVRSAVAPKDVAAGRFVFADGAVIYDAKGASGATVVVHHDSFGQPLQLVLPHAFQKSTWLFFTGSVFRDVLLRERPDVLIYLTAERYLHRAPPKPW